MVLQLEEVGVRLELRIGLGDREEAAENARHLRVGLRRRFDAARIHRRCASAGDLIEHLALVRCVTLNALDKVGDEVGAAAKLHRDPAERFLHQRPQPPQLVVNDDDIEKREDDKSEDDPADHDSSPDSPPPNIRGVTAVR